MPKITIGTEVINFPEVNSSPNWAPAIVRFAQAVSDQLEAVASSYVISAGEYELPNTSFQILNSEVVINKLVFPVSEFSSFEIHYTVDAKRNTGVGGAFEYTKENGIISAKAVGNSFEITRETDGTDASVDFSIDDTTGQVSVINLKSYSDGRVVISYSATMLPKISE